MFGDQSDSILPRERFEANDTIIDSESFRSAPKILLQLLSRAAVALGVSNLIVTRAVTGGFAFNNVTPL